MSMKVIKVRVVRNTNLNEPSMKYPDVWNAKEVDRNGFVISPGLGGYGGDLGRGADEEFVLAIVKEKLATTYSKDTDISILSKDDANASLVEHRTKNNINTLHITNPETIEIIKIKIQQGVSLSNEEAKAINPEDTTPGINKIKMTVEEMVSDEVK